MPETGAARLSCRPGHTGFKQRSGYREDHRLSWSDPVPFCSDNPSCDSTFLMCESTVQKKRGLNCPD